MWAVGHKWFHSHGSKAQVREWRLRTLERLLLFVKCLWWHIRQEPTMKDICCGQNLWKYFTFNIPVSILSAMVISWNYTIVHPKHGWSTDKGQDVTTQSRSEGRVGEVAGDGWMDREKLKQALQDLLAVKQSPSSQWSTKQSVYCKVGRIPGEEEKWFLLTGGKLTLSALLQQGRCWISI